MLEKAREFAHNAREAVELASRMPFGEERNTLLHMTETWLLLAQAALEHARFMLPVQVEPAAEPEAEHRPPT
ncbi:hypothetical protein [Phenylobacterium sp.]|jgi:hypothetical protein|uniref:hypothetical protein n=1 Tax=Phenylobacterium sp. TaxID=1871053 RepID=UPI002F91CEB8